MLALAINNCFVSTNDQLHCWIRRNSGVNHSNYQIMKESTVWVDATSIRNAPLVIIRTS